MCDTPIIFAFEIMGDGAGREIFGDEVSELLADDRIERYSRWYNHFAYCPCQEVAISGPLALMQTSDPEDMVSIQIFVDLHRVVSFPCARLPICRNGRRLD